MDAPLAHAEPAARVVATWTSARIRSAELLADAGNLELAADLCDALLADDRIATVLQTRVAGLLGCDVSFERTAPRQRDGKRAERFLTLEEDWYAAFPDAALGHTLSWGIMLGVGLAQNLWTPGAKGRLLPVHDPWHPRALRWDTQAYAWRVRTADAGEVPAAPGDGRWILHAPRGTRRPWAFGAWRALARWWMLKQYALQDWARYSERASGVVAAKPPAPSPNGVTDVDARRTRKAELVADLRLLHEKGGAVVLPAGYELDLLLPPANTYETFAKQSELADLGATLVLAGQNLTTDVQGGSRAAAQVHQAVAATLLRSDASALSDTLHTQALSWWAEYNLGSAAQAPWPEWDTEEPEDDAACAQTRKTQGEALTLLKAVGVDIAPVAEEFDLELLPEAPASPAPPTSPQDPGAMPMPGDAPDDPPADMPTPPRSAIRSTPEAGATWRAGQLYVDDVADGARRPAARALDPLLGPVLDALAASDGYDDLRARLLALLPDLAPTRLRALLEAATGMAAAAGAWSARSEAP